MKPISKTQLQAAQSAAAQLPANGNGHQNGTLPAPDADAIAAAVRAAIEAHKDEPNPFPLDTFPKGFQNIIKHWKTVYRRPEDYHGCSMLAAASGAIGNAFQIEHVVGDVEPLILWMVIVGPPSSAKSPIMKACLKPLFRKEREYGEEHKKAVDEWESNKVLQQNAGVKKAYDLPRPKRPQRIVSDATIESLIKIFPYNWKGVLSFKDEFIALMKSMNAYKQSGQDLEHYLSMWSGSPIMLNRSGIEDAVFVESPFISMLGSIQPRLLSGLTEGGKIDNGFWFRLLFGYPENVKIPKASGMLPDPKNAEQYALYIDRLNNLPTHPDRIPTVLKMSHDAFKIYETYKTQTEQEIINQTEDENTQSLYGKIISYTLRLAGVLDLMEFVTGDDPEFYRLLSHTDLEKHLVSAASVQRAIKLSEYFTRNSLKILTRTEDPTAALPIKQQKLYEKLPATCTSAFAITIAGKNEISEKTARRLIYNKQLFTQNKDGSYRKLYT
ncbi:MAG: DUF3987 domain-containing protein [Bacteroidota bacterium]